MNINKIILVLFLLLVGFTTIKYSFGLFTSAASNNNNTFTASNTFPTLTPTSTPAITSTPTPTPTIQAGDVVINEINWAGSESSTADEWIELRNMTTSTIDLSNWVIENLGDTDNPNVIIPSGESISANGFYLIANYNETNSSSKLNIAPDFTTTEIALNNTGEQLKLKTDTNFVVDTANGTGTWFKGSITPKKSMERIDTPGDGTVSTNWQDATTNTNLDAGTADLGSPRAANGL